MHDRCRFRQVLNDDRCFDFGAITDIADVFEELREYTENISEMQQLLIISGGFDGECPSHYIFQSINQIAYNKIAC